tara:strand:+ start:363 stop:794 length:432 start_codon:yes stop_codon:yes gene_type:complete
MDENNIALKEIIKEINEKNLLYLTSKKIKDLKNTILQRLQLSHNELITYHKKLNDYRYIDELDELKIGSYIRWFDLRNLDNIKLSNGGIIIDFKFSNNNLIIVCKNNVNRIFSLKFNSVILFQKLRNEEIILIKIIDFLNKNN